MSANLVACRDANGQWLRKVAVGVGGRDFPCVLVRWEDEPNGDVVGWPQEDVTPLKAHPDALSRVDFLAGRLSAGGEE